MTNLITTIKTAAENKGYIFMQGNGRSFEQDIHNTKLTGGEIGLMYNLESSNDIINERRLIGEEEYNIILFIFRKFEATTHSSLSETKSEKQINRIDDLKNKLRYLITELTQCTDDMDLISATYTDAYNVTASNVDGVFLSCKLKLFNQWATNS